MRYKLVTIEVYISTSTTLKSSGKCICGCLRLVLIPGRRKENRAILAPTDQTYLRHDIIANTFTTLVAWTTSRHSTTRVQEMQNTKGLRNGLYQRFNIDATEFCRVVFPVQIAVDCDILPRVLGVSSGLALHRLIEYFSLAFL